MTVPGQIRDELLDLLWSISEGNASPDDIARLEELAGLHPETISCYAQYTAMCGLLSWERNESAAGVFPREASSSAMDFPADGAILPANGLFVAPVVETPCRPTFAPRQPALDQFVQFIDRPVFSYLVASVVLCLMFLGGWAYKISHDYGPSFATNSRRLTAAGESAPQRPNPVFVARVTGMRDCRWADPATETYAGAFVPLGRKYSLSSGLMEITYRWGAKVILEGPCRYEVESAAGGFLALGKLTARVESEKQSPKPQDLRPKTKISKSPNLQISKFAVRTPTAIVTDLGTEFGVEVGVEGDTYSHVFLGKVNVRVLSGRGRREEVALGERESVRVTRDKAADVVRWKLDSSAQPPERFVRRMPPPARVIIFQNFESVLFGDGDQFTGKNMEIGYAGYVGASWRGIPNNTKTEYPTVSTEHAHSGNKSVYIHRNHLRYASMLQGYTTLPGTPLTGGRFAVSFWLYRSDKAGLAASVGNASSTTGTPSVYVAPANELYVNEHSSSAWRWRKIEGLSVPTDVWFGARMEVDLNAKKYNVWYDSGSGWRKVASNVAIEDKEYCINAVTFNPQSREYSRTWIDDVELRTGRITPEYITSLPNPSASEKQKEHPPMEQ